MEIDSSHKTKFNLIFYNVNSSYEIILLKSKFIISSLNSLIMGLCLSFGTMNKYVFPNYIEFTKGIKTKYIIRITSTTMMFYISTLIIRHLNKREKLFVQNYNANFNLNFKDKALLLSKDAMFKIICFSLIYKFYYFKNTFQLTNKSNFITFLTCAYLIDMHELYKDLSKI